MYKKESRKHKPENCWKHDGSCQSCCCHTGGKIRSEMVLVKKDSDDDWKHDKLDYSGLKK